jgi:hypothetical protein
VFDLPIPTKGAAGIGNTVLQIAMFGGVAVVGGAVTNFVVNAIQGRLPEAVQGAYTRPVLHALSAAGIFAVARKVVPGRHKTTVAIALAVPSMIQTFSGIISALWTEAPAPNTVTRTIFDVLHGMSGDDYDDGMQDYLQVGDEGGGSDYAGTADYLQVGDDGDGMGAMYEAGMGAMYEAGMGYDYHEEEVESAAAPF